LLVLALNICTGRVCESQPIESHHSDNTTVGESLAEADQIFSDPARVKDTCHAGKELCKEINNGKALRADHLYLAKVGDGGTKLTWTPPYLGDDQEVVRYEVWRSVRGADLWELIEVVTTPTFTDFAPGEFDYEVLTEIQD